MSKPLIGVSGSHIVDDHGTFAGYHRSYVNDDYIRSVIEAGGVPVILPFSSQDSVVREMLGHMDGLLLSGGHDLSGFRIDRGNHTVRTSDQLCIGKGIMPLRRLRKRLLIGSKGCIIIGLVLVQYSRSHGLLIVELAVAGEIGLCKGQLRTRRLDLRIALVRLLHDILRVDDHENIACAHPVAKLYITAQDLPPYLKGQIGLIASAHRAGISRRISCR